MEFIKKWIICLIFSVELFIVVWLTQLMTAIISALSTGLTSGIFWLGMDVTEFFFLIVFGFVPLVLLSMWLLNPTLLNGIMSQFGLSEKLLGKEKEKKEAKDNGNSTPTHDQVRYAILSILYKKAETSPDNSAVNRDKLIEILNVKSETVDFNVLYLAQEKLINLTTVLNTLFMSARITSSGINVIEHKEENKNRLPFLNATIPIQIQNKIGLINL